MLLWLLPVRYGANTEKQSRLERRSRATEDFKFASAVASFGMLLRNSQYKGNATYAAVAEIAQSATGDHDPQGYRKEFVEMVKRAKELSGE